MLTSALSAPARTVRTVREHVAVDMSGVGSGQGVTAGIMRIGNTVRRPARPSSHAVHAFLSHLHSQAFVDAPVPMGVDDQGRKVLSYVPGRAATEPFDAELAGDDALAALARLVRRLDAASEGWTPPDIATWGGIPGSGAAGVAPLFDAPSLVGHRDFFPGNVIVRRCPRRGHRLRPRWSDHQSL